MPRRIRTTLVALGAGALLWGCGVTQEVSFKRDVRPILDEHCGACHGPGGSGYAASGLDLTSYEGVMKGTKFGPVVIAGSSMNSTLLRLVDHKADSALNMPHGQTKIPEEQIETIRRWINEGAKDN